MLTVRKAISDDKQALKSLYKQLVDKPNADEQAFDRVFGQIDKNGCYHLLVAVNDENKVVGTAMGIICHDLTGGCNPFMVIENVVADEKARGTGVGKLLMNELESIARQNKCGYIILVSGMERADAHSFYEKLGYPKDRARGFKKDLLY